jgi:signal transduction histidine kinase
VLELLNKREGVFTDEDEMILTLLGSQVGIALANTQLYENLRASLDRLTRLMKVGAAISQELDLDTLLAVISQTTSQLLQAERSTVFIVDAAAGELWSRVAEGMKREEIRIPLDSGIAGSVARTGVTVRIGDAYSDPRFNPEVDKKTGYRTQNILCAPMRNLRGQVIGVFQVLNKRGGSFSQMDEQLLASLSSQAAVAIENAQLHEQVQKALTQLQTLDRMKSDFLNAISHELRTPLAPILGYTEILLAGGMGALPQTASRGVQAIAESGKRLLNLIESLLAFIRLDQGEVALNRESLDLLAVLKPAVEGLRARAEERRVALTLELPPDLPMALADSQELGIALNHLLDNAVKFTQAGGSVTVRGVLAADAAGQPAIEITVQDTGIGIPAEEQARVFERFYQIDSSMTRQYGGVGIGLAVVRQVVEAHGSTIHLESEPGKGSTFRFTLPVAA